MRAVHDAVLSSVNTLPLDPHVFVVGCPRSGTTLLQRMLDNHPDLAVVNDTHLIIYCVRQMGPTAVAEVNEHGDTALTQALVTSLCASRRFHRLGLTEHRVRRLAAKTQTFGGLARAMYAAIAADRGKTYAGEKTPNYVLHIPTLHRLFPEARFVHIIRDGRDVALSILDWATPSKGPGKLALWAEEPEATSALWWRRFVETGRRAGSDLPTSSYAEVRYEALVADPPCELERLAEFLCLPYSSQMAEFHVGRTRSEPGLNAKAAWLGPQIGLRDWRSAMEAESVELFELLAGDLLGELGLERSSRPPGRDSLDRADRCNDWWREHARRAVLSWR